MFKWIVKNWFTILTVLASAASLLSLYVSLHNLCLSKKWARENDELLRKANTTIEKANNAVGILSKVIPLKDGYILGYSEDTLDKASVEIHAPSAEIRCEGNPPVIIITANKSDSI